MIDDGYHRTYRYQNGYGASVVSNDASYGGKQGLFEIAVMHDDKLCYATDITDDVIGNQDHLDIANILAHIKALPRKERCHHDHVSPSYQPHRQLPIERERDMTVDTHIHEWKDEVEISRFAGNPHRKCKVDGCHFITLDIADDESHELGSCGCVDYHYADCPTRSPQIDDYDDDPYDNERW